MQCTQTWACVRGVGGSSSGWGRCCGILKVRLQNVWNRLSEPVHTYY
jgi:hypothetical protein